jgi:hypothetical protein
MYSSLSGIDIPGVKWHFDFLSAALWVTLWNSHNDRIKLHCSIVDLQELQSNTTKTYVKQIFLVSNNMWAIKNPNT